MTHDILALTRYGLHWHTASRRLFRVRCVGSRFEATHTASWYTGIGATIEAAMHDAALHWTEDAPLAEELWPEFRRVAA